MTGRFLAMLRNAKTLKFRATGPSRPDQTGDSPAYHVMEGESAVGRIYKVHGALIWTLYSHQTPGAVAPGGQAGTFEQARHLFKEAWAER